MGNKKQVKRISETAKVKPNIRHIGQETTKNKPTQNWNNIIIMSI